MGADSTHDAQFPLNLATTHGNYQERRAGSTSRHGIAASVGHFVCGGSGLATRVGWPDSESRTAALARAATNSKEDDENGEVLWCEGGSFRLAVGDVLQYGIRSGRAGRAGADPVRVHTGFAGSAR